MVYYVHNGLKYPQCQTEQGRILESLYWVIIVAVVAFCLLALLGW